MKSHAPELLDTPQALLLESAPAVTAAIPGAKMAVIRKPVFAVLKSGVVCTSHRHEDCLGVNLPPVSDDLGTPGYDTSCTADSARAVIDGGWDGVNASHTLTADGEALLDVTEAALDEPGIIDWFFHFENMKEITPIPGAPAELGEGEGYEHFTDVRRLSGKVLTVKAEKDGETLTLTAPLDGAEAFYARSPGNPSGNLRDTIILRRRGTCVRFDVKFTK